METTSATVTHVSDDFDQAVRRAAGVADTLHGRKEVRRRVTQQHTHFVGLTSEKGRKSESDGVNDSLRIWRIFRLLPTDVWQFVGRHQTVVSVSTLVLTSKKMTTNVSIKKVTLP